MAPSLEQVIARVPFLAHARVLTTAVLPGGITNCNYKIEAEGLSCVLRITGENTALLGIDRKVEHQANRVAGELGIAPEVLYVIEPEGYLVTRFIAGAPIPPEAMRTPKNLGRVATKLRRFHQQAPPLSGGFDGFRRVEHLTAVARERGAVFPEDLHGLLLRAQEVETALRAAPHAPAPCHSDLLNLNFLDARGELFILDWEYAGMGDIFFDLANFAHHHQLDDEQIHELLREYFGAVTPERFARLKLMWPLSTLHEALWGVVQSRISTLAEDFPAYAARWFTRTRAALADPRWSAWLAGCAQGTR